MAQRRYDDDDHREPQEEEDYDAADDEEEEGEGERCLGRGNAGRKRTRSDLIDDLAEEDDDDEEEYGGGRHRGKRKKNRGLANLIDEEAQEADSDGEEEEEELGEFEDLIDNTGDDIRDDYISIHRRPLLPSEDEDIEDLERTIKDRYRGTSNHEVECDEEATEVEQQALLPDVRDPKLWLVKCATSHEREVAVCLMQKCIDKGRELKIGSAIALDHLESYIYVEAHKEDHVKEAVKGMCNVDPKKIMLVPIKERTDVLSVECKAIDVSPGTWVRMKSGAYQGDLAKVVYVDNVQRDVIVKLIPRIDLQALANKLEGREVSKKKAFTPHARRINVVEARELHIRVERKRHTTGDYYDFIGGKMFKDGFLYKTCSIKSIRYLNVQPTFDELEKFWHPSETGDGDMSIVSQFANRKKGHFMKGDKVIIVKGDLKNLKGLVEKVVEDTVHIKPHEKGLPKTLGINHRELCKYFEPGNHVKVISGVTEGATGMVVSVEGQFVNIVKDTSKDHLRVFTDYVVECSPGTSSITLANGDRNGNSFTSRFNHPPTPLRAPQYPTRTPRGGPMNSKLQRGGRGHDALKGSAIKIRLGPYKGYKGRVKDVKGSTVHVELESSMRIVTVDRSHVAYVSDKANVSTPFRETSRYGIGSETPMHPCRSPPHPYMTPLRDPGATPIHDGMRTPMRDGAWNPSYTHEAPTPRNSACAYGR